MLLSQTFIKLSSENFKFYQEVCCTGDFSISSKAATMVKGNGKVFRAGILKGSVPVDRKTTVEQGKNCSLLIFWECTKRGETIHSSLVYSLLVARCSLTSDEWRATSDERRATSDERRATSDERRATSDERRATSDERRGKRNSVSTIGALYISYIFCSPLSSNFFATTTTTRDHQSWEHAS